MDNGPQSGGLFFAFGCGQTKTEVFEYDDVIHLIQLTLHMLCERCDRISIVLIINFFM